MKVSGVGEEGSGRDTGGGEKEREREREREREKKKKQKEGERIFLKKHCAVQKLVSREATA